MISSRGAHRDPHSFPTRRSSDLESSPCRYGRSGSAAVLGPGAAVTGGGRKSTRLNSSHRCISDAVFCLKKKSSSAGHLLCRISGHWIDRHDAVVMRVVVPFLVEP